MCGIAGFIDFRSQTGETELRNMTNSLKHRGPDADGYFYTRENNYSLGLGHRRLSIIDLSPLGNQPMQLDNGKAWIVFNGEIYNYREIKDELMKLGHSFRSNSDTEVILHAIQEWGANAVNKFIGMFAFVIYDVSNATFTCYRDRAGVKPFYYYWNNNIFLFGSELKALLQHSSFSKEINLAAVGKYFQYGYIPSPHCIYRNTYKLEAAHYLTVDLTNRELQKVRYWDVHDCYNADKVDMGFDDAILKTEQVLEKAFRYRMVSDVPVGVFLSGGYDSVCLTSLLQKDMMNKLNTFTIGMEGDLNDEAPYAKKIAQVLGTDHHEYYCTESNALEIIPTLPYNYDEPFGDNSAIPTILVSKMARQEVTVALSADGGDEIFGGYNRYKWILNYNERLAKIPRFARQFGSHFLKILPWQKMNQFKTNNILRSRYERLESLLRNPSPQNIFLKTSEYYSSHTVKDFFNKEIRMQDSMQYSQKLKNEYFDLLSYVCALDYENYMNDDVLQKVDRATMSVGLEGREPFLDQHIIEWAARLPFKYKIQNGNGKYILKKIVHKYVSEELMDRPKKGFSVPISRWLDNELKSLLVKYSSKDFLMRQDIFRQDYINNMINQYYVGKREKPEGLWFFLMFQMWYEKWVL